MISGMILAIAFYIIGVVCVFKRNYKGILYSTFMIALGYFLIYDLPRILDRPDLLPKSYQTQE